MNEKEKPADILDKKFILAALVIGVAYSLIVVFIGYFSSKEAAGVAGVALTAVASGIFKQFETLRFKQLKESEGRQVAVENPYVLLTLASSIVGAQSFSFVVLIWLVIAFVPFQSLGPLLEHPLATLALIVIFTILVTGVTFMVGTYYSVRALRVVRYTTVVFAVLIVAGLQLSLPALFLFSSVIPEPMRLSPLVILSGAAPWLIYLLMAIWGARLARPKVLVDDNATPESVDSRP